MRPFIQQLRKGCEHLYFVKGFRACALGQMLEETCRLFNAPGFKRFQRLLGEGANISNKDRYGHLSFSLYYRNIGLNYIIDSPEEQ